MRKWIKSVSSEVRLSRMAESAGGNSFLFFGSRENRGPLWRRWCTVSDLVTTAERNRVHYRYIKQVALA